MECILTGNIAEYISSSHSAFSRTIIAIKRWIIKTVLIIALIEMTKPDITITPGIHSSANKVCSSFQFRNHHKLYI